MGMPPQKDLVLGALAPADRIVPIDEVSIDWRKRTVTLTRGDRNRHPHERAKPTRG